MRLYAVIWVDRHVDVSVTLFTNKAVAKAWAWNQVSGMYNPKRPRLTQGMRDDGWLWYATYSTEGDFIRVQEVAVNEVAP